MKYRILKNNNYYTVEFYIANGWKPAQAVGSMRDKTPKTVIQFISLELAKEYINRYKLTNHEIVEIGEI